MSNILLSAGASFSAPGKSGLGWPIKKTPSWNTIVQTPASRRGEVRVSLTPNPVWNFELDLTYIRGDLNQSPPTSIQALLDFYGRVQGSTDDWLYLDPYDNETTSSIGFADGVTTQFQIGRILNSLSFEMMQNVFPSLVLVNGTSVPPGPQPSGNYWYSGLENLLLYSQDFTQDFWSTNLVSSITHATTAPDGTSTGSAITFSGNGYITQGLINISQGDTVIFSVWLKVPTGTLATTIQIDSQPGGASLGTNSITLNTTWQRFSIAAIIPFGLTSINPLIGMGSVTNGSVIHAWGAQLERNPTGTPSSYVATSDAAPVVPRGLLTFATAPVDGATISVTFNYYYRCRFLEDQWEDLEEFMYQIWDIKSFKFRSIIL